VTNDAPALITWEKMLASLRSSFVSERLPFQLADRHSSAARAR
jgi:hypothetical protein